MENITKLFIKDILECIVGVLYEQKDYLTELDSAMGDGDLGITMTTGFKYLYEEFDKIESNDLGNIFMKLGMLMNSKVPSTMGTLISICLIKGAKEAKGKEELTLEDLTSIGKAAINGVMEKGRAKIGDKTMLDALYPAVEALEQSLKSEVNIKEAFKMAYEAAEQGVENTKELKSVHGRAAYYGEKSLGRPDSGAVAVMLIFKGIMLSFI